MANVDLLFSKPQASLDLLFGDTVLFSTIMQWNGVSWVPFPLSVWDGASWISVLLKRWDSNAWVDV